MSDDAPINSLITEAVLLERVADSICSAAVVCRTKGADGAEQSLWRLARKHRIQALLARGKASAQSVR